MVFLQELRVRHEDQRVVGDGGPIAVRVLEPRGQIGSARAIARAMTRALLPSMNF
jgi:hypothetical protein